MKRFVQPVLVAALLLGAGAAQAQLSAGHIMLTGSAGYSSSRESGSLDNDPKRTSGRISPQVGYFIADNLAIGLGINYEGTKTVSVDEDNDPGDGTLLSRATSTDKSTTMTFGPFVRYYKPVGERAAFFGQLGVGFGTRKDEDEYKYEDKLDNTTTTTSDDAKYSHLNVGLMPGFTFFPTDNFGLEIMMGGLSWDREKKKDLTSAEKEIGEDHYTNSGLDLSLGLQGLTIGATWYLGGK